MRGIWILALAGCQSNESEKSPDLDDPKVLSQIVGRAVSKDKLEPKRKKGYLVLCVPGTEDAYSGWMQEARENGKLKTIGKLKGGKKEGQWTSWGEDGKKKSEIHYVADVMNGTFLEWHPNGEPKSKGQTKDGEMDGRWIGWYENGNRSATQVCSKGLLVFARSWKPDGSQCPETNATGGNGIFVEYTENGSILKRQVFSNGIGKETK